MSNNMYTHEERSIIVKYLIDNNIDGYLQGNALWKRMEREGVLNRTWQSMRTQFKNTIINMLHMYGLTENQRRMILHGFGRKTRPAIRHSARSAPLRKPIPFSSDSDSDTTLCVPAEPKRRKRDSGSTSSLDLLSCNTNTDKRNSNVSAAVIDHSQPSTSSANCDIRGYMTNTSVSDNNKPTTSTPRIKDHETSQKHSESVLIIDSDDDAPVTKQKIESNKENEPFSLEEDTQLIMFFKTHQYYLEDVRNNFVYLAFNYDTPTSLRTPAELKSRFVEHIMPKLYTYDCLTYEEMVTYYDRTDIDVPVEFQQLIRKTVAEQKKNKQMSASKLTVDSSTQAKQRSNRDKTISIDVELAAVNRIQDHPNPPDTCTDINAVRIPVMVDASTQVQPAAVDKVCSRIMVDASTQVQPRRVCNTMVDAATQVSNTECQANTSPQQHLEDKLCNTDAIVQHVQIISDNMLHIYLPDHDKRTPLLDIENIHDTLSKSQKHAHKSRPKKYRMLNDTRYVDVALDSSVRQIAIDKCQAELLRLTAEVKRLEVTLCKLKGYDAKDAVSENQENLDIKHEHCTHVSDTSNNTIIVSSSEGTEGTDSVPTDNADSQTGNQTDVLFNIFQTELDKRHISTQTSGSQSSEQQMNTSQDGEQEEISEVIAIQPDIEMCTRQPQQPMEVEQTSDESDASSACQTEPLNLSTTSHESDSTDNANSGSGQFYSALSQNDLQN